jgi:hypothetical protein
MVMFLDNPNGKAKDSGPNGSWLFYNFNPSLLEQVNLSRNCHGHAKFLKMVWVFQLKNVGHLMAEFN